MATLENISVEDLRQILAEVDDAEGGLSWKTARPEFHKSDERAQEDWQEGFKKTQRPGRRIHGSDD